MHAAYIDAALIIKQFDFGRAEDMRIRERIPQVIGRVLLIGNPTRNVTPSKLGGTVLPLNYLVIRVLLVSRGR
jgi:hypothetical protein